jgi:hypothetical protein
MHDEGQCCSVTWCIKIVFDLRSLLRAGSADLSRRRCGYRGATGEHAKCAKQRDHAADAEERARA